MSRLPPSHSPDVRRLVDDGYEVALVGGYLVVADVPYVDARRRVRRGRIISEVALAGDRTAVPSSHQVWFEGMVPCDAAGRPLAEVHPHGHARDLGHGLTGNHVLCSLPVTGEFPDYHAKMTTFAAQLSAPAQAIDPLVTARTGRVVTAEPGSSPFVYVDTASARAAIGAVSARLEGHSVGIVGLGGTGGYVLDLLAKTPVARIHLFDDDRFLQHNAFRAPGAASLEELGERRSKVAHFDRIYSRMHAGIVPHAMRLAPGGFRQLDHIDFVFLCLDGSAAKAPLVAELERRGLSFIDVGMGLHHGEAGLVGQVRVTTSTPATRAGSRTPARLPDGVGPADDPYATNIQVADLNALNAALAVIRWKRLLGFYADLEREHFSAYTIDGNHLLNEDHAPVVRG